MLVRHRSNMDAALWFFNALWKTQCRLRAVHDKEAFVPAAHQNTAGNPPSFANAGANPLSIRQVISGTALA
jgi:hypothetical protein